MKKKYAVEPDELQRLRREVESRLGCAVAVGDDFQRLCDVLQETGCGYVSATTLKRIWGYITDTGENYQPSAYSVRVLCKFLGFNSMEEFSLTDYPIQSKEYVGAFVESHTLPINAEIELRWPPNRVCRMRHVKPTLWEVVEASNSRLRKGDLVECGCFTQKAPAYFSRVYRESTAPMTYIAGSAHGVTYRIVDK